MKHRRTALPAVGVPVFFDRGGKRWGRIRVGFFLTILAIVGFCAWIVPVAAQPIWTSTTNQDPDYPSQLLASGDINDIPLVGEQEGTIIERMVLVERLADGVYLKDPFSDMLFRKATDAEVKIIGDKTFAMESLARPPDKTLMLTFDDGPDATYTPQLLDLLSREHVQVTFFALGVEIVQNPDVFNRIIREGHMVGNHTINHTDLSVGQTWRNREEIIGNDRIMRAAGDYSSRLFRIPLGDPQNNPLALLQSQQLGYLHINMDIDTVDWSYAPGVPIPEPVLDGKGHVILMHDGGGDRTATLKLVEDLIHQAKAKGYSFSTVQPLLPLEYVPVHENNFSLANEATLFTLTAVMVLSVQVVTWLFWFGAGSMLVMSVLYVVLALTNKRRQGKRKWTIFHREYPLVSIIVPAFNEEMVITRTLDALRDSDYPNFEVIVIDDGSTDKTLKIVTEYAEGWQRLRVISQSNAGKSAASNNGIQAANGEIIVTLDGDTIFRPSTVRMMVRHFLEKQDGKPVGAVAGHVKVGNRGNMLTAWQALEYISGICVTRMAEGNVGAISIVPGSCAAWSKQAMLQAGGYSHATLAEDADLTLAIQRLGYKVVQENGAVALTEVPMGMKSLAKQRLRWTYGNTQALWKHKGMLFRPRYGVLGMVTLPYALLSLLVPLFFMPFTVVLAAVSLAQGNWHSVAYFAAFVAAIHLVISIIAISMVGESWRHLLAVPIYRLIYEPLRAYLIYATLMQALKGKALGWYKPERTNSVVVPLESIAPVIPLTRARGQAS